MNDVLDRAVPPAVAPRTVTEGDLDLASYFLHRGLQFLNARRLGRSEFEFTFRDPDGKAAQLRVEYVNSESAKQDGATRTLKKMVLGQPVPGRGAGNDRQRRGRDR